MRAAFIASHSRLERPAEAFVATQTHAERSSHAHLSPGDEAVTNDAGNASTAAYHACSFVSQAHHRVTSVITCLFLALSTFRTLTARPKAPLVSTKWLIRGQLMRYFRPTHALSDSRRGEDMVYFGKLIL